MFDRSIVLQYRGKRTERQIEATTEILTLCELDRRTGWKAGCPLLFEPSQDSKCLSIPFKPAVLAHALVEGGLSVVAERRMAQIMCQRCKLNQIRRNLLIRPNAF